MENVNLCCFCNSYPIYKLINHLPCDFDDDLELVIINCLCLDCNYDNKIISAYQQAITDVEYKLFLRCFDKAF